MTICRMLPLMSAPLLSTVEVTMIATSVGMVAGGLELFPGRLDHVGWLLQQQPSHC